MHSSFDICRKIELIRCLRARKRAGMAVIRYVQSMHIQSNEILWADFHQKVETLEIIDHHHTLRYFLFVKALYSIPEPNLQIFIQARNDMECNDEVDFCLFVLMTKNEFVFLLINFRCQWANDHKRPVYLFTSIIFVPLSHPPPPHPPLPPFEKRNKKKYHKKQTPIRFVFVLIFEKKRKPMIRSIYVKQNKCGKIYFAHIVACRYCSL